MKKSYKVKLEPNKNQNTMLFQRTGTARYIYNWTLAKQQENYSQGNKFISDSELRKELTQLKKQVEFKWLNQYSNNIPKQAIKDACNAYKNFFKGLSKFPKFKNRRKSKSSFYVDTHKIKFTETHVFIEKFGWVKLSEKNRVPIDSSYYNPRVTHDGIDWYVSVTVDSSINQVETTGESIGIDLGIKELAFCSNGMIFSNINKTDKVKSLEKKMKRLQRQVSRKYEMNKDGNKFTKTSNIIKLEQKLKKVYRQLTRIRTDYIHQTTTKIVKTKPSRVVMEDLNVIGMLKNRHLSKAVAQQKLYEFKTIMKSKCESYGINFAEADRWFPSSKMCSDCGFKKNDLKLSDRVYECSNCGLEIDRDYNASLNLSNYKIL